MLVLGTLASAVPANAEKFWMGLLTNSSNDVGSGVAVDSSGNMFVSARSTSSSSNPRLEFAKFNSSGAVQFQKQFTQDMHPSYYENDVTLDSSGNIYTGFSQLVNGYGGYVVTKHNSSGVIQWQRKFGQNTDTFIRQVKVDSSGNVYANGIGAHPSIGYQHTLIKYNSSGTYQWGKYIKAEGSGIAIDSSGNVYAGGFSGSQSAPGVYYLQMLKYDTSGSLQWSYGIKNPNNTDSYGTSLAVDSSDNIYGTGIGQNGGGTYHTMVFKRNSSGTLQWQRKLLGVNTLSTGIATDSSANVYVCGYDNKDGSFKLMLVKYNSSGVLQWQRSISNATGGEVTIGSNGYIYLAGVSAASGNNDIFYAKLPADGSKTGTYTVGGYSFVYGESTITDSAGTYSDSALGLSASDSGLSSASSSYTITDTSFANPVTTL
jgi:hypothetical protein